MRMVIYYLMQLFNVLFCSAEKQSCFFCSVVVNLPRTGSKKVQKTNPFLLAVVAVAVVGHGFVLCCLVMVSPL